MKFALGEWGLLSCLQEIQKRFGYLPEGEIEELSRRLKIPISQIYGLATFYRQFLFTRLGENVVMPCRGTTCYVRGGERVFQAIKEKLGIEEGETTPEGRFTLKTTPCTGACALAPTMMVGKQVYGKLTPSKALGILLTKYVVK